MIDGWSDKSKPVEDDSSANLLPDDKSDLVCGPNGAVDELLVELNNYVDEIRRSDVDKFFNYVSVYDTLMDRWVDLVYGSEDE